MKIKIHYTLYLFLALSFFSGIWKETMLTFFILALHEFGHFLFLKLYKRKVESLVIFPFGGIITYQKHCNRPLREEFYITIGGLAMNLLLGICFHLLHWHLLARLNLSILLFNLIPIFPLDGGRLFGIFVAKIMPYKKSLYVTHLFSFITIFFIMIINMFFIHSIYIYLALLMLGCWNISGIMHVRKEYLQFLTSKYLHPNYKLKERTVNQSVLNPVNHLFQGKNTRFRVDELEVEEGLLLHHYFQKKKGLSIAET